MDKLDTLHNVSVLEKHSIRVRDLRILYLGPDSGTSQHRALSLGRLGHNVSIVDPRQFLPNHRLLNYWIHHTGALFLENLIQGHVLRSLPSSTFDMVWVDGGHLIPPTLVRELKNRYGVIVNFNVDDPYGCRDGEKWRLYLRSVPHYDLVTVVRKCNIPEAAATGAKDALLVYRSADEVAHRPRPLTNEDRTKFASEVLFIGTWMPERGPFFARLIQLGVPVSIYGDRWAKAKEWPILRPHWRGPGLYNDEDYARAIQCAKVCLGLLSKGNRDLSTTRTFEVPHLGGVFCAERTSEHTELYQEDFEAVFWNSPEECAEKCKQLLNNHLWRRELANKGRARCLANRTTNEQVLAKVIARAIAVGTSVRRNLSS